MGSGKTTIGKILSKNLNKEFFDSDHVVEQKTGVKVPLIFEYEGEIGFRKREESVLKDLVLYKNIVLATGGGIILSKNNRKLLIDNGYVSVRGVISTFLSQLNVLMYRTESCLCCMLRNVIAFLPAVFMQNEYFL